MFTKFGKDFIVASLNFLKYIVCIVCVPVAAVFMVSGVYFLGALILGVILIDAAFVCAVLAFVASFYVGIVALFTPTLWSTIGGWWTWIWGWFAGYGNALWPHLVKSLPPYLVTGVILMLLWKFIEHINTWTKKAKRIHYVIRHAG